MYKEKIQISCYIKVSETDARSALGRVEVEPKLGKYRLEVMKRTPKPLAPCKLVYLHETEELYFFIILYFAIEPRFRIIMNNNIKARLFNL